MVTANHGREPSPEHAELGAGNAHLSSGGIAAGAQAIDISL